MNTKQSFLGQRLTDDCLARVQSAIGRELEPRDWRDISWDRKDFWKEVRLNPQYENPELLRIQEAVEEYISPWLNAIYETGDVEGVVSLLPEISLKSLSKITGLRVSQIRQTINEVGLSLDIPYSELTLVAEIIEGEISPKKVIREITYS